MEEEVFRTILRFYLLCGQEVLCEGVEEVTDELKRKIETFAAGELCRDEIKGFCAEIAADARAIAALAQAIKDRKGNQESEE